MPSGKNDQHSNRPDDEKPLTQKKVDEAVLGLVEFRNDAKIGREFICGTWMPGLYYGNDWFRQIDRDVFFNKYLRVLIALLERPKVYVQAAVLKADPDSIVGYAICETTDKGIVLHWVYTRFEWRKKGIAAQLIPKNIVAATHLTRVGKALKPKTWIFDPFL